MKLLHGSINSDADNYSLEATTLTRLFSTFRRYRPRNTPSRQGNWP